MEAWEGCKKCGRKGVLIPDPDDLNGMKCAVCGARFHTTWDKEQEVAGVG
jgi:hypothetical protein